MLNDLYTTTSKNYKNLYSFGKQFMLKNIEYKGFYNIQSNGQAYTGKIYITGKSKKLESFIKLEANSIEYKKLKPKIKIPIKNNALKESADDQTINNNILLERLIIVPPDINDSAI
jgi:hypothetical protein